MKANRVPRKEKTSHQGHEAAELQAVYYSMVETIVQSDYERTAEGLRALREGGESAETEALRRLVAIRLSMKKGLPGKDLAWLDVPLSGCQEWIVAERNFMRGYLAYRHQQFESGIAFFKDAERKFETLGMHARALLAAFNALIGDLEKKNPISLTDQLTRLRELEIRVREKEQLPGCARVLALVYRQRAHAFEDQGRLHACLEEIFKAISVFELHGPASDYHLALLHAADIFLDLNDSFRARGAFERIVGPVDSRIEFPLAVVRWRLGGLAPDPSGFPVVPVNWGEKFNRLSSQATKDSSAGSRGAHWTWDLQSGRIECAESGAQAVLKPSSMEGRLIRMLLQEKASKSLLIETFWPEQSCATLLDNRLHRMIFRLNKKADLVQFDGKHYRLNVEVRIKE
jgi:hypothetical protein